MVTKKTARKKAKKTARKKTKKATTTNGHGGATRGMMVPVEPDLFAAFQAFRDNRRDNRTFPWTVRDCMEEALADFLAKHRS